MHAQYAHTYAHTHDPFLLRPHLDFAYFAFPFRKHYSQFWNLWFLFLLCIGNGLLIWVYLLESYARAACPIEVCLEANTGHACWTIYIQIFVGLRNGYRPLISPVPMALYTLYWCKCGWLSNMQLSQVPLHRNTFAILLAIFSRVSIRPPKPVSRAGELASQIDTQRC